MGHPAVALLRILGVVDVAPGGATAAAGNGAAGHVNCVAAASPRQQAHVAAHARHGVAGTLQDVRGQAAQWSARAARPSRGGRPGRSLRHVTGNAHAALHGPGQGCRSWQRAWSPVPGRSCYSSSAQGSCHTHHGSSLQQQQGHLGRSQQMPRLPLLRRSCCARTVISPACRRSCSATSSSAILHKMLLPR